MILALAKGYLGQHGDPQDPLASPICGQFEGLPPLLIQVGDRETGLDDSCLLAERARAAGVDVQLEIFDDMIHVFQLFAAELPTARQAIETMAQLLIERLR